jgi:hypothetical protein
MLTAGALAVTVAACGGDDQEAADTTAAAVETTAAAVETTAAGAETTAPAAETTAAPAEGCGEPGDAGEINVFLIPSPSSTAIQSFIPAFEEASCIKVNFSETPYGEAHQKQLLAYQQGDGQYDIAQFDNTFLAAFGAAQAMSPLDDYLAASTEYDISDFSAGQQEYGATDLEVHVHSHAAPEKRATSPLQLILKLDRVRAWPHESCTHTRRDVAEGDEDLEEARAVLGKGAVMRRFRVLLSSRRVSMGGLCLGAMLADNARQLAQSRVGPNRRGDRLRRA